MDIKANEFFDISNKLTDAEIMARIQKPNDYQPKAVIAATEVAKNRNLITQDEYEEFHKKNEIQWFYEKNGKRIGPVSETTIFEELTKENIHGLTLIWKKGFDDWIELKNSELQKLLISNKNQDEPPPLRGSKINNTAIWLLAFAPIIGFIIETIIVYETADTSFNTDPYRFWWITLSVNILFGLWDDRILKNAGLKAISSFLTILVPIYIWQRANVTKQKKAYFWVWIGSFILTIFLSIGRDEELSSNVISSNKSYTKNEREPVINEYKPENIEFNKSDPSTMSNGNLVIGIKKIRELSGKSIWEQAEQITITTISKNPYGLLGHLIKVKGKVTKISKMASDPSENWNEVLLLVDNPNSFCGYATIGVIYNGNIEKLNSNQTITCAGYYIGRDGCSDGICECFIIVSNIYNPS